MELHKIRQLASKFHVQFIIFLIVIAVVIKYSNPYEHGYWEMITAIATIVIAGVAFYQLSKSNEISVADFTHRLTNDFFNEKTNELIMMFENGLLEFRIEKIVNGRDEDKIYLFELSQDKLEANPYLLEFLLNPNRKRYSSYEIDDNLLGHFENIGIFESQHQLTIDYVYDEFSYYIELVHENEEIKKYREAIKEDDNSEDVYEKFDYIYDKLKCYGARTTAPERRFSLDKKKRIVTIYTLLSGIYLWLFSILVRADFSLYGFISTTALVYSGGLAYHVLTILIDTPITSENEGNWDCMAKNMGYALLSYLVVVLAIILTKEFIPKFLTDYLPLYILAMIVGHIGAGLFARRAEKIFKKLISHKDVGSEAS